MRPVNLAKRPQFDHCMKRISLSHTKVGVFSRSYSTIRGSRAGVLRGDGDDLD